MEKGPGNRSHISQSPQFFRQRFQSSNPQISTLFPMDDPCNGGKNPSVSFSGQSVHTAMSVTLAWKKGRHVSMDLHIT